MSYQSLETRRSDSKGRIMLRVVEKLGSSTVVTAEVRDRTDYQPPNSCFCSFSGREPFKKQPGSLNFQDRFDIILEMRLGGVAKPGINGKFQLSII